MPDMGQRSIQHSLIGSSDAQEVPPPAGLSAHTVALNNEEYLVLSFPSPVWNLPANLTAAEREVTLAILRGAATEVIARERGTSRHTVANQIASIFEKLGVTSRVELASAVGALGMAEANEE
jgi:DNA-binding NarL/FixJ family response regulator